MRRLIMVLAAGALLLAGVALPSLRASAQPAAAVTDDNLDQSVANAKTAADHEAIAAYYDAEAASAEKKAALHRNSAETYEKLKISKPVYMANMCKGLAEYWDKIAKEAKDLAKAHRAMAKAAGSSS